MMEHQATVTAGELTHWTGYVTDYAGQRMTIHNVKPGPTTRTVTVTLSYPADSFTKPIEVELLKVAEVEIYA